MSQLELENWIPLTAFALGFSVYIYSYSFNPDSRLDVHSAKRIMRLLNQAGGYTLTSVYQTINHLNRTGVQETRSV